MCNTFVVCLDKLDILCIYLPHCTSVWTNEGFVVVVDGGREREREREGGRERGREIGEGRREREEGDKEVRGGRERGGRERRE